MSGSISDLYGGQGVQSAPDEGGGDGDYKPLPAGWYPVSVETSEIKPNSNNNGMLLKVRFKVLSGKGQNRTIFETINLTNPSTQCQQIGVKTLGAFGDACNIPVVSGHEEFIGKHLDVRLKIEAGRTYKGKTYDADNKVCGYAKLGAESSKAAAPIQRPAYPQAPAQQQGQPYQAPAAAAAPAQGGMPWDKPAVNAEPTH